MRTFTYFSDNGLIASFVDRPPYLAGLVKDDLGATAQIERSYGHDGAKTYGVNLNQLIVNLIGIIVARGNSVISVETVLDEHKSFLDSCFNPKTFGILLYNDNSGGKIVKCRPTSKPTYGEIINHQSVSFDIELLCDESTWESFELHEYPLGALEKLWQFPFELPLIFGTYHSGTVIANPTRENIRPVFEIYTNSELVTITNNTTGKYISVVHAIADNQTMRIDCKEVTVKLYENGVLVGDVSNWVTVDSSFIELVPGENELTIRNEQQNNTINANVIYRLPIM